MISNIAQTLVDIGIPKDQIKLESQVKGAFNLDIRYKDFAFEILGPYHFVHDPTLLEDPVAFK